MSWQGMKAGGRTLKKRLLIVAAAVILVATLVPIFKESQNRSKITTQVSGIRVLLLACRTYAAGNSGGKFPKSLEDLYPDFIDDVDYPKGYFLGRNQVAVYTYFPGHSDTSFSRSLLIASPLVMDSKRAVGFVGGHVRVIKEEEYQKMLESENKGNKRPTS